jgi:hypothetical protein
VEEQEIALENHADHQAHVETDRDGERLSEEMERLRRTIETIRLWPLDKGVTSRSDALHALGFSSYGIPDCANVWARYRQLART